MKNVIVIIFIILCSIVTAKFIPTIEYPVALPISVRPGSNIPLFIRWKNSGSTPALQSDGTMLVFVHLETSPTCGSAIIKGVRSFFSCHTNISNFQKKNKILFSIFQNRLIIHHRFHFHGGNLVEL